MTWWYMFEALGSYGCVVVCERVVDCGGIVLEASHSRKESVEDECEIKDWPLLHM